MAENENNDLQEVAKAYSKGKKIYLFIKKYWGIISFVFGLLSTGVGAGIHQWKHLQDVEYKRIPAITDSLKSAYKKIDSLCIVISSIQENSIRNARGHIRDSVFIDYIYNYKTPFGQWGNQK